MNSPGCFGVPSVFTFKSSICGACPSHGGCQKQAFAELQTVAGEAYAKPLLKQHIMFMQKIDVLEMPYIARPRVVSDNRLALTEEQEAVLNSLPKKIAAFVRSVWTRGGFDDMVARFKAGDNPFDQKKNRTHHAVFEELKQSRCSRIHLVDKLRESFGWTYAAAYSEISAIWKALIALRFAFEDGDFLARALPSSIA